LPERYFFETDSGCTLCNGCNDSKDLLATSILTASYRANAEETAQQCRDTLPHSNDLTVEDEWSCVLSAASFKPFAPSIHDGSTIEAVLSGQDWLKSGPS
jgi:hypothetical protein